jgi:hypothetical protein
MSKLDNTMMQHMNCLVLFEKRPFSYHDFLSFEINEKEYTRKHGTFRTKVSQLIKAGKVDLEYLSTLAFYNFKGVNFGKIKNTPIMKTMMTPVHTVVLQCNCNCHFPNEMFFMILSPLVLLLHL